MGTVTAIEANMNPQFLLLLLFFFHSTSASINYKFLAMLLRRHIKDIKNTVGNQTECYKQIEIFQSDLADAKLWPITMLDANGKLESGILGGNLAMVGQYDECLGIIENINGSQIEGQYCTALVEPSATTYQCMIADDLMSLNMDLSMVRKVVQFRLDICTLAACSATQLQAMWDFIENRYQVKLRLVFDQSRCAVKGTFDEYSAIDIAVLVILSMLALVVLSSTLYDVLLFRHLKDQEYNIGMAFSIYTNTKRLISTRSTDPSSITCIYGLRVISMAWIVLGHTYLSHCHLFASNNVYLLKWVKEDSTMFVMGALSGVDTFLVISGFLIVYVTAIARERGTPIHILVFYGHRLVRLTPALAGMILVYVGVFSHLGDGPFWTMLDPLFKQNCLKNWWATILYIQNYYDETKQCVIQAWYLSVDTQLYMVSPILLMFLFKWPKTGLLLILTLLCACIAGNIKTALHYDLTSWRLNEVFDFYNKIYLPTHLRASPWLIGVVLGYIMIKFDNKPVHIRKGYVIAMWFATLIIMLLICYGYIILTNHRISVVMVAVMNPVIRVSWAICICWIIFACTKGYGGCISTFLSSPLFCVLSRITYGIFITHVFVIWFLLYRRRTHTYVDNFYQFQEFWGNYMISIGLGFIWTLVFESPASILQSVAKKKADVWIQKLSPGLLLK
ncbi:hypothetical protein PPYR_07231 [Photinus pyralis]|uniref:Nose resistant-to-fluoxetine protein N-terminal domain-containing protein n=1 Tax=Photinus pyralis TaxID=7054 RepID=A0A5N4APW9_PHOPY|nr:nose resistant to fluoxetine protein 6-like [Photinus pyralis]KAB0799351.1 hypothetical protein PPYR_07231 [Photinus pyralis]